MGRVARRGRAVFENRREIRALHAHLQMDAAQAGRELADEFPFQFADWADKRAGRRWRWLGARVRRLREEGWGAYVLTDHLPDKLATDWRWEASAYVGGHNLPTHMVMDKPRLVARRWLMHFTDDAQAVLTDGFHGNDDLRSLAFTAHSRYRVPRGYNFAFEATDRNLRVARSDRGGGWKYGQGILLFTAPGILGYHAGDDEDQVIFWGPDARDMVLLDEAERGFCVGEDRAGRPLFCSESVEAVTNWLSHHMRQYRRLL